ncbi:MAG: OmpA family protein [Crocinitomicaceae bacterium]
MKTLIFLLSICVSGGLWSQSLREANRLFNKYEYARAAAMYEEVGKTEYLSLDEYKNLAYSYYITGSYEKCVPVSDSILKTSDVEPFFHYLNGEAHFGAGHYDQAKAAYEQYAKLDNEFYVDNKIKSCDLVKNEVPTPLIENKLGVGNNSKANMTGEDYIDYGSIEFIEVGQDSSGTFVESSKIDDAELVLARPFIRMKGGDRQIITLGDEFRDAAITSFTLNEQTSDVWVTVSRPLSLEQIDKVPHLYQGKFDKATQTINELTTWKYSGYEDSSACAHATLNADGDQLIFSKIGESTQGADLYMSSLYSGEWSTPTPLSYLNSRENEMYPLFLGDSLFSFASDGHPGFGGLDIYTVPIVNNEFGDMKHISSPVNGSMDDFNFVFESDSSARYTSNRLGGLGDDDIYNIIYRVEREVVEPVPDSTEFFAFVKSFNAPIFYFEFDKYNLSDSVDKINQLVEFLANNSKSSILIEGHTDRRGTKDYNAKLSKQRAEALKEALIRKGIKADQIETTGLGSTDPQNKCDWCSVKMHAENRYARIKLRAK